MSDESPWEQFATIARTLSRESGFAETVQAAVDSAPRIVAGCDEAGVSIIHAKGRISTEAATSEAVGRGDELQYELHEGPCLQSIREAETVHSADLASEERWPRWSRRVVDELGFRSMLCVQLFTSGETFGALNLYSREVDGYDADDRHAALALAAHVAVALRAADEIENLESALATRDVIGQAKGRLMERFGLGADQAFNVLLRFSQDQNIKLVQVAEHIATDGAAS